MSNKILVTKTGKNALDSTSLDDFYLHSDYPLLKVHASGTFSTNILGEITITHNLGYKPFVLVFSQFVDTDGLGSPVLSTEYYQHDWTILGATVFFTGMTRIYDNTVEIEATNTDVIRSGAVDGIYYIFKEET